MYLPPIVVGTTGDASCLLLRGRHLIFGWNALVSSDCKNVAYALL